MNSTRSFSLSHFFQRTRALSFAALLLGCASPDNESSDELAGSGMPPGSGCTPGQQVSCPCGAGQADSVQVCTAGSVWDVCQCNGVQPVSGSGGAAASGGADSGTSGGAPAGGGDPTATGGDDAGTGGTSANEECTAMASDMISDMETEALGEPPMLNTDSTRQGPWFSSANTVAGASVTASTNLDVSLAPARCDSTRAVHAEGTAKGWGATVGFHFNSSAGVITTYDASAATGLSFYARGEGTIRIELLTSPLDPESGCTGKQCSGFHGKDLALSADWQRFDVPFSELAQPKWSSDEAVVALDTAEARGVQFKDETDVIDFWIDDIGFY